MCLFFCHRRAVLVYNHTDCWPCNYTPARIEPTWRCVSCRHRQEEKCGLTQWTLPAAGGCCHYNVDVATGLVCVPMQALGYKWSLEAELKWEGIAYQVQGGERLCLAVEDLYGVPRVYGLGTGEDDEAVESGLAGQAPEKVTAPTDLAPWWV